MKTILVPVDFSQACDNALDYALKFVQKAKFKIHLLNVYDYAFVSTDPYIWVPSSDELIEENLRKLEVIREKIQQQFGKQLTVICHCEPGTVIDTVNEFAERHQVDLIIMGMQGGGFISEKIMGSTTTSLMRRAVCPVLGIGKDVQYSPVNRIVLATDHQDADYKNILKPLKDLITMFHAHLYVLYIVEPHVKLEAGIVTGAQVMNALQEVPYTWHTLAQGEVAYGINQFIEDKAIDIAVIVPRKHSFFYSLFHESNTKKLAFHVNIPLLALHE